MEQGDDFPEFCRRISISQQSAISLDVSSADSIYPAGTPLALDRDSNRGRTLRIEKDSQGGRITIRLIGHFQSEHIEELQKQLLRQNGPRFVLDLTELTFVDLDVIRFLGSCEAGGTEVINCAPYIREWMNQDQNMPVGTNSTQEGNSIESIGLFVTLEARPGKEADAEAFLKSAQPLALDEKATLKWYAIKLGPGKFGIFDTFANEAGRTAHLSGEIAKALGARANELLAVPPQIEKVDVLASTPLKN